MLGTTASRDGTGQGSGLLPSRDWQERVPVVITGQLTTGCQLKVHHSSVESCVTMGGQTSVQQERTHGEDITRLALDDFCVPLLFYRSIPM
jgi:hypothetical protein